MRLDKLIEERLATSRKEMKRLFQQGKVLVDQQIERNPSRNVDSRLAEDVAAFAQGIVFHGGVVCQPAKLTIEMTSGRRSFVHLEIAEGKFHQVKKMFLARGKKVIALKRVAIGPLELGDLLSGEYRNLTQFELESLANYFR